MECETFDQKSSLQYVFVVIERLGIQSLYSSKIHKFGSIRNVKDDLYLGYSYIMKQIWIPIRRQSLSPASGFLTTVLLIPTIILIFLLTYILSHSSLLLRTLTFLSLFSS